MPWDRSDNPWIRKHRRMCLFYAALTVVFVLLALAMPALLFLSMRNPPNSIPASVASTIAWAWMWPLLVNVIPIGIMTYQTRREWRILDRVPRHDAMVCPRCLRAMERIDEVNVRCPKDHAEWPAARLVKYWEQYGLARMTAWRTLASERRLHEKGRLDLFGRFREWVQRHPVAAVAVIPLSVTILYTGGWVIFSDRHWLEVARLAPFMFLIGTGAMCIGLGLKQRRGEEAHCAVCDYTRIDSQMDADSRCPECGEPWNEPGGTVRGAVSSRPVLAIAGGALLVLAMAMIARPMQVSGLTSGWFARALPTALLIDSLAASPHGDAEEWAELARRTLTLPERDRLAGLLLDQRIDVSYFSATDGSAWLDAQVNAGTLGVPIVDRFFNESLALWFDGPARTTVGQAAELTIEGDFRLDGRSWRDIDVAVGGFQADDDPEFYERESEWRDGLSLDSELRINIGRRAGTWGMAPKATVTWDRPGKHVVHFTAWIVVRPNPNAPAGSTWLPDGQPNVPADAIRVIPVRLSHAIEVVN